MPQKESMGLCAWVQIVSQNEIKSHLFDGGREGKSPEFVDFGGTAENDSQKRGIAFRSLSHNGTALTALPAGPPAQILVHSLRLVPELQMRDDF